MKYRQRGYQDSDRNDRDDRQSRRPPRNNLTTEEKIQRRSMRHAIDRDAREVVRCHVCGHSMHDFGTIVTDTECPKCSAALHCCRACRHFDTSARWQCRAEITEAIGDKVKANQCAQYEPVLVLDATGRRSSGRAGSSAGNNDAKSQFDNLFKR